MSYLCEERTSEDARQDVAERRPDVERASKDLLITYRNSEGARPYTAPIPPLYVTGYISSKKYARIPGEFEIRRRSSDLQFRPDIVGYCDVGIPRTIVLLCSTSVLVILPKKYTS